ncbi:hypothetical protein [Curtobacterium sp. MCBA15_005]|uniref:hypothetical protein n=1 Tax=Curtobacterium sp. MCBA15_005 TaxID=1898734 RepID=UPI0008DD3C02|nr:hypothetical protein [Curtobacterium sp. MCBA15_005]OII04428.1 hypothetical protein BIU89_01315 [Curtobacterium sp. MCBA15_005]
MGIRMGESYRVDRAASARTVANVRTAASGVSRRADEVTRALAEAASGSPEIAAALRSFASGRTETASRIGKHLQAVSAVGTIALAAVDEADGQMASTADHAVQG